MGSLIGLKLNTKIGRNSPLQLNDINIMSKLKDYAIGVEDRRKQEYELNKCHVGEIHTAVWDKTFTPEWPDEFHTVENEEKALWLVSFLSHLGEGNLFQKSSKELEDYVPVSTRLLKMVLGSNTDEMIQFLLDRDVIECGGKCEYESSLIGDEVIGYRINPELMVGDKKPASVRLFKKAQGIEDEARELELIFTARESYIVDVDDSWKKMHNYF